MATRIPFSAADEQALHRATASWPLRDRVLFELGLRTGFRARELASITLGQVWDGTDVAQELTVSRQNLKGGSGVKRRAVRSRTVPLVASLRSLLRDFVASRQSSGPVELHAPLFPSRKGSRALSPWTINHLVKEACADAGLPRSDRYGSHSLRKTFCARVFAATGNNLVLTQAAMGHSDIRITQRYLPVAEGEVRAAILAAQGA